MQDGDKVLSQNEIDAMLSGGSTAAAPADEPAPAPAAEPAAPPAPAPAVQTMSAGGPTPTPAPDTSQLEGQVQALTVQLQALTTQVEGIVAGLQATVGYNAQGTFACKSCSSQGHVAARLTCTACGTEDWWGWFPPQQ